MQPLARYEEIIRRHVDAEFMEEGFSGSQAEAAEIFLKKNYVPFFIPECGVLFVFRPATNEQAGEFPLTSDAELLMMGKTEGLGLFKAVEMLEKLAFSCYPWLRVWARSSNKTLARFYARMGMKFVAEKDNYFFYLWERGGA